MRERSNGRALEREPVRALFVIPAADFGGVERQMAAVLPQLPDWGVEALPLLGPGGRLGCWLEDRGCAKSRTRPTCRRSNAAGTA